MNICGLDVEDALGSGGRKAPSLRHIRSSTGLSSNLQEDVPAR